MPTCSAAILLSEEETTPTTETQPCPSNDDVIPEGLEVNRLKLVGMGISGVTVLVSETVVIKQPVPMPNCKEQIEIECKIYQCLGQHPRITKFLRVYDGMLVLERPQHPLRQRLLDLRKENRLPVTQDALRWALQIAEGLQYIHSRGVRQVDIGPANVLLDWADNAKLSDFAGSSLDGSVPTLFPSLHSEHPRWPSDTPTIQPELFALGSTLYEVETTYQPYYDKTDGEVQDLFARDSYPDTEELVLGPVIRRRWTVQYENMAEVVMDIRRMNATAG